MFYKIAVSYFALVILIGFLVYLLDKKNWYCIWEQDEEGNWQTDCDEMFVIIDGTPEENQMKYCAYCGRLINQKLYNEREATNEQG